MRPPRLYSRLPAMRDRRRAAARIFPTKVSLGPRAYAAPAFVADCTKGGFGLLAYML